MIYLIFMIVAFLTFYTYIICGKDLLSTTFLSCCAYLICVFVAMLYSEIWGVSYTLFTLFILLSALIAIGIGEFAGKRLSKRVYVSAPSEYFNKSINISKGLILLIFFFGMFICYYQYQYTLSLAASIGYRGEGYMMEFVRNAYLFYDIDRNYLLVIGSYFSSGAAFVCTYIFINNITFGEDKKMSRKVKRNMMLLLPSIPYSILILLSTGRTGFMMYIVIIFFLAFQAWQMKNNFRRIKMGRFIMYGIVAIFAFFLIFWFAGYLTGKSSTRSISDTIATYVGSSIAGLNEYLKTAKPNMQEFGLNTFAGIRSFLNRFGLNLSEPELYRSDIYFPKSGGTNLYTAIRIYFADFGYFGVILFQFYLGFFCSLILSITRRRQKFDIWVILVSYYGYFPFRQIFAESFISYMLTTTRIFELTMIFIAYYILGVSRKRNRTIKDDKFDISYIKGAHYPK